MRELGHCSAKLALSFFSHNEMKVLPAVLKNVWNIKLWVYLDEGNNPIDVRSKKTKHDCNLSNAKQHLHGAPAKTDNVVSWWNYRRIILPFFSPWLFKIQSGWAEWKWTESTNTHTSAPMTLMEAIMSRTVMTQKKTSTPMARSFLSSATWEVQFFHTPFFLWSSHRMAWIDAIIDHVNSCFYLVYVDGPDDGSDEVDDCLYDVQDGEDPYPHPEDLSGCEGGINSQRYRINMKEKTQTHCPYVRSC